MKIIKKYACEVCFQEYLTDNEALECEKKHPEIKVIEFRFADGLRFPSYIKCIVDGVEAWYKKDSVIPRHADY